MTVICHRVNSIEKLKQIPTRFGIEVDVRHDNRNDSLYLNHDPGTGVGVDEFLDHFQHASIVWNVKESGIEDRIIDLSLQRNLAEYFLLDVEFPYIYQASRKGVRDIAIRYSEDEPIEQALLYKERVDWVWIDTNTRLPLDRETIDQLTGMKTCLVCPERWGRPEDIESYIATLSDFEFLLDAVMTDIRYAELWEQSGVVQL